jgi:DNA (cytosine-5)-methyltransferase 1
MQSKVFSFFAGTGFLDLGFEDANFDIVFVNENCKAFLNAYKHSRAKLAHKSPLFGYSDEGIEALVDNRTSSSKELKQYIIQTRTSGALIGFIGGPPCPDFSNAGKHQGFSGENGNLTRIYFDLVKRQQPDWFLFENVKGLLHTKKHRQFFDEIFQEIHEAGYAINREMLNALEFGVPQYRERIIIFGIKRSLCFFDLNQPVLSDGISLSELKNFCPRKHKMYETKQVLRAPWPETHAFENNGERSFPDKIPLALTVQHWFDKNDVDAHPNAKHHFLPTNGNDRFNTVEEGCASGKSYKRLHRWRYSPTAAYGNNEVHLHPYKPRRLSAAEALAIQSMPKNFELPANMPLSYMFKTIGNGVPYLMAKAIAQSVQEYLFMLTNTVKVNRRAAS